MINEQIKDVQNKIKNLEYKLKKLEKAEYYKKEDIRKVIFSYIYCIIPFIPFILLLFNVRLLIILIISIIITITCFILYLIGIVKLMSYYTYKNLPTEEDLENERIYIKDSINSLNEQLYKLRLRKGLDI